MQGLALRTLPLLLMGCFSAHASHSATIAWRTCDGIVDHQDIEALGPRLKCGKLEVPFDHARPGDSRTLALDVVLATAGAPSATQRTLLLEGSEKHANLPARAVQAWDAAMSGASNGALGDLADAFDIVALANRHDIWKPSAGCATLDLAALERVSTDPEDNQAWDYFKGYAGRCADEAQHLGTSQRAADVEWLRRALGIDKLDILAGGHGAGLVTSYATQYPQSTGRVLIDNGINLDHGWDRYFVGSAESLERERHRQAYVPAAMEPRRWELGDSAQEVRDNVFGRVPMLFRTRWAGLLWEPADLRAAVEVARLYLNADDVARKDMLSQVEHHRFMIDDADDARVRRTARAMVAAFPEQGIWRLGTFRASFLPALCNDLSLRRDEEGVRQWLRSAQDQWLHWDQRMIAAMVVCSQWKESDQPKATLGALSKLPPFVWLHYGEHRTYPLAAAQPYLDELPNVRQVVIGGPQAVVNGKPNLYALGPAQPCAGQIGAHYLLTGETPSQSVTACPAQGTP